MLNAYRAKLIRDGVIYPRSEKDYDVAHGYQKESPRRPKRLKGLSKVNAILARRASFKTA